MRGPALGTRTTIVRALAEGRAAGARGDRPTVCPYGRESLLRTAWIRGYAQSRPLASRAQAQPEPDGR